MTFIVNHWEVIVSVILLVVVFGVYVVPKIIEFVGYPTSKKWEIIKKYLLAWVTEAETKFSDGDYDLIINYVYSAFISKFPFVMKWISEDKFKSLVDDAIKELEGILAKSNKTLASLHTPVTTFSPVLIQDTKAK